jgi:hypothetical protein
VVTDNGVAQTVEAVAIENVPIDVTLFSHQRQHSRKFDEMKDGRAGDHQAAASRRQIPSADDW